MGIFHFSFVFLCRTEVSGTFKPPGGFGIMLPSTGMIMSQAEKKEIKEKERWRMMRPHHPESKKEGKRVKD